MSNKNYNLKIIPDNFNDEEIKLLIQNEFCIQFEPLESELYLLKDDFNGAFFIECHIKADKIVKFSTTSAPLDPDDQSDYRANREVVGDHDAFDKMKEDAIKGRVFSNIVAEYTKAHNIRHPLKIIGGQHRFEAIRHAFNFQTSVNIYHGIKVYFGLDKEQRFDVQLISNTNIAVSSDLFDRMQETLLGPELRSWCQKVGFLESGKDFADRPRVSNSITVRAIRTFIMNFYRGKKINVDSFSQVDTTPILAGTGDKAKDWIDFRKNNTTIFEDVSLSDAGKEFSELIKSQRKAHQTGKKDYAEKALQLAVLSAWAYIAGVLQQNEERLKKHYSLKVVRDPLKPDALATGRHKTDPDNYRGLGYRTGEKERGRCVEVFYLQAEKGHGISNNIVDAAIKQYYAKKAYLDANKAKEKL